MWDRTEAMDHFLHEDPVHGHEADYYTEDHSEVQTMLHKQKDHYDASGFDLRNRHQSHDYKE